MATLPSSPFSFSLLGAGRVGTAVGALLVRAGHRAVGVWSRDGGSAARAAERLGCTPGDLDTAVQGSELVLIGTIDSAIEDIAQRAATALSPGTAVVHFAGSLGLAPLASVSEAGGRALALHPVQACPDVDTAIARLPGSAWGITCAAADRDGAIAVVGAVQGIPVFVDDSARPAWHAAAVTTSNGTAALMSVAEALLTAIGVDEPEHVLGPLALGTVQNAIEGGGGGATLTGPVVRDERATVARHLAAIETTVPELARAFRATIASILEAAIVAKRISPDVRAEWENMLEPER